MILIQRPCSTRFLKMLKGIERFRISSPSVTSRSRGVPACPRVSPRKKITVELQFRHAQTICSSEIPHPVPLESPANTKRRATTRSFPCTLKDFERIRDQWIVQKRAFQSAGTEGNAKCLLPPVFVTRSGTTPSLLTCTEQYSTLEESVDYSKCVFPAFYRGGTRKLFFRWKLSGVPAGIWLSPQSFPRPRCPLPVPVAPCPSLGMTWTNKLKSP
jgi:hypothetical protein